jgi:hypothetical protein
MPRLLLKVALLLSLVWALASFAIHATNAQPDNLTVRGFTEGCATQPPPCWYGLVPEQISFDGALQQLINRGFPVAKAPNVTDYPAATIKSGILDCEVGLLRSDHDTSLFGGFYFRNCQSLTLGDLLDAIGTPDSISTTLSCSPELSPMSYYWMQYAGIGSAGLSATPDSWTWLSTSDPVVSFDFGGNAAKLNPPQTWEGFIPFWRYNQLHPEQILSSRCGP